MAELNRRDKCEGCEKLRRGQDTCCPAQLARSGLWLRYECAYARPCVGVCVLCVGVCVVSTKVPSAELPDILTIVVVAAETQPTASVPPNQEYSTLRHVDFDVLAIYVHSYGREREVGQGSNE